MLRSLARAATVPALLWGAAAGAQDLRVVGEIPVARPSATGWVFVRRLAPSAPLSVLTVSTAQVSVSPATGGEPVVSLLDGGNADALDATFGDFDGDGNADLAVTIPTGIRFLRGDGSGRFADAGTLDLGLRPYAIAAADFDGDGRADVAAAVSPGQDTIGSILAVCRSSGGFRFDTAKTTLVTACCGVATLSAADLDGDGRADLVVTADRGYLAVWKSAGDGTFTQTFSALAYYASRPAIADVDGDGRPDLVYANRYPFPPFPVVVLHNDGGGLFHSLASVPAGPYVGDPVAADLDGSGRPGVFFLDQDGGGPFGTALTLSSAGVASRRVSVPASLVLGYSGTSAVGDRDGDGRDEVFVLSDRGVEVLGAAGTRTDVAVVPILVSTTGLLGSRFDSDLLLTNSGSTPVHVLLRYAAASGGGSGVAERDLLPGRQLYAPSAAGFLRGAGLPIAADENVIGTLRVETTGASSPRAVSATVRTTTPAGAGVAYGGVPNLDLLRGPAILPWLVETAKDRTNLALVNAGVETDGAVTLRVTVFPANPASEPHVSLPDVVLAPGEFRQIGRVLAASGLATSTGWARVTRVGGNAPYLAWAAVNDAGSGDGSFVAASPEEPYLLGPWIVPNAVQTERYATEFVATNPGAQTRVLEVTLVATGAVLTEAIAPGASFYVPDLFAELRRRGAPGAPAAGAGAVSPLSLKWTTGTGLLFAGIRVSTAPAAGRSYGVFVAAAPRQFLDAREAVVPDLRQDESARSNLGVVNLGSGAADFRIDVFAGADGSLAGTGTLTVAPNGIAQINAILRDLAPGTARAWARVTPAVLHSGEFPWPFAAYAVINDGAVPGQGTDDGSFLPAIPE